MVRPYCEIKSMSTEIGSYRLAILYLHRALGIMRKDLIDNELNKNQLEIAISLLLMDIEDKEKLISDMEKKKLAFQRSVM